MTFFRRNSSTSKRLVCDLCGIPLKNPVLAASGTFAYGIEFESLVDLNSLGGIVVKGLSKEPIDGNRPPRLWETEGGMMNSIGLQNIGARAFIKDKLPALRRYNTPIFANVFGYAMDDYLETVRILEDADGLAAYELKKPHFWLPGDRFIQKIWFAYPSAMTAIHIKNGIRSMRTTPPAGCPPELCQGGAYPT